MARCGVGVDVFLKYNYEISVGLLTGEVGNLASGGAIPFFIQKSTDFHNSSEIGIVYEQIRISRRYYARLSGT